ncbi:PadR family transcriptional regulator [Frigoribacterium sp. Leaf172]|uniref:PadR family transcriptional regulator n=1 Tax=Frigoribacterium sp. Leaf172 TaxID=1736285 RepID=UPI0006F724C3|nr:PadR family transcriptional regulator [Frigoribacterium sp. Leaf172]KQR63939.1 PadR family transcriptional regulator [Frigoribacterium sp. Leaf172]
MSTSRTPGSFGVDLDGMWQAMDQLRSTFDRRDGARAPRGEVRAAILALLAERPMHGYQVIHEIDERSGGDWKPSAGSVYPTLQLLADEGLIVAEETDGRKVYSLTDSGRAAAGVDAADASDPWAPQRSTGDRRTALPRAGVELARATAQVGRTGTSAQVDEAVAVLDEARRRIYSILARD